MVAAAALGATALGFTGAATPRAAAQERTPAAAEPGGTEKSGAIRKFRGVLRWRRAVWAVDSAGFSAAAEEFEGARNQLARGSEDFTLVYLLGLCRVSVGDSARGIPWLDAAKRMSPDFPGNVYADSLRIADEASRAGGPTEQQREAMLATLGTFLDRVAVYGKDGVFAAELEFLGLIERGTQLHRSGQHDRAVADFERAIALTRAQGREPAALVVRSLALCHQRLNQVPRARELIEASLRRDPGQPSHYHVLGQLTADLQDLAASRTLYAQAVARKPDYAQPLEKLAYLAWDVRDLHDMLRSLDAAEVSYRAEWQAAPADRLTMARTESNLRTARAMYWIRRAERAQEADDPAAARTHHLAAKAELSAALSAEPQCVRAIALIVRVLFSLGETEASDDWKRRMERMRESKETGYGDTFC